MYKQQRSKATESSTTSLKQLLVRTSDANATSPTTLERSLPGSASLQIRRTIFSGFGGLLSIPFISIKNLDDSVPRSSKILPFIGGVA